MLKTIIAALLFLASFTVSAVDLPTTSEVIYYDYKTSSPLYNQDMFMKWEEEPKVKDTGIYAAAMYWFEIGSGAYTGMQIDQNGVKYAIFSVWDSGSSKASPQGLCNRFGHEGTGAQCMIRYNWVAGREYRLRVWAYQPTASGNLIQGFITDMTSGVTTQIGSIEVPNTNGKLGFGYLKSGSAQFQEYFGWGSRSCSDLVSAKVTYRGPYGNANNDVYEKTATIMSPVSQKACPSNVNSSKAPYVTVSTGKGLTQNFTDSINLWTTPQPSSQPTNVHLSHDCFFNWAEKTYPGYFAGGQGSNTNGEYYYRYYSISGSYIAVSSRDNNVYYMAAFPTKQLLNIGAFSDWKKTASCQ